MMKKRGTTRGKALGYTIWLSSYLACRHPSSQSCSFMPAATERTDVATSA
ncbi:hypothetical protein CSC18_4734 [Klebsiella aerogenes]|nr:hypothetical protein CSC18_4734 [Klebsiella aerogenes]